MGTPCAPSYANIFMGDLEHRMLQSSPIPLTNLYWKRFIDDIFFIWTPDTQDLDSFKDHLNSFHTTIKFTFDSSTHSVPFLDTLVTIQDKKLCTQLYSKPTDAHLYLRTDSCHPQHTFNSIPYSQALRIKRICSNPDDTNIHLQSLSTHLQKRMYSRDTINEGIQRAKQIDRNQLLTYNTKTKNTRTPLVLTYHPKLSSTGKLIQQHLPTLNKSSRLQKIFPDPPPFWLFVALAALRICL